MYNNRKITPAFLLISCLTLLLCSAGIIVESSDIPTPTPLPASWSEYSVSDFHIALPERWTAVDIEKEDIDTALNILQKFNNPWSRYMTRMLTTEEMQELIKFWAVDLPPTGYGYASVSVLKQTLPITIKSSELCTQYPTAYQQTSITVIESQCGIDINGLDSARFQVHKKVNKYDVNEYQVVFIQDQNLWVVTMSVDNSAWQTYIPTFETIAESFWIDQ